MSEVETTALRSQGEGEEYQNNRVYSRQTLMDFLKIKFLTINQQNIRTYLKVCNMQRDRGDSGDLILDGRWGQIVVYRKHYGTKMFTIHIQNVCF